MKYIVAEVDGGLTKVLREADTLFALSKMDVEPGSFPSVFVCRDDIRGAVLGVTTDELDDIEDELSAAKLKISKKIENLTDTQMIRICEHLQDCYVEESYWDDLKCVYENLKRVK